MTTGGGLIVLLGSLVAFGPLAVDLYLPALPAIGAGLGASPAGVQASITVFLAGFAVGMLLYGPISDHFGRRVVLLAGIALFILASLACALSTSIGQLVGARLVQALGGGAASVLARAVVRDLYPPGEAIRQLSLMAIITTIAPLLAPLLGSALLALYGWRSLFLVLVAWGMLAFVLVWARLPESLPPEKRGAMGLAKAFAAYGALLRDPRALALLVAGGAGFAAMFAYITAGAYYFIAQRGLSPAQFSLLFGLNAFGIILANYFNSRMVGVVGPVRMARVGSALLAAGALVVLGVVMLNGPLGVLMAGLFLAVSMTGLLGANCVGLLMAAYPHNAGAAAALFGSAQFGLGMLASALVSWPGLAAQGGLKMAATMAVCGLASALGARLVRTP